VKRLNERYFRDGLSQAAEALKRLRAMESSAVVELDRATENLNNIRSMIGMTSVWIDWLNKGAEEC
jgi:hypothetical protein